MCGTRKSSQEFYSTDYPKPRNSKNLNRWHSCVLRCQSKTDQRTKVYPKKQAALCLDIFSSQIRKEVSPKFMNLLREIHLSRQ